MTRALTLLQRLFAHPRLEPVAALLLRAWCVREAPLFVAREVLRRGGRAQYHLRSSGLPVVLRHGTGDVVTLGEVFHVWDYEPPAEVDALLRDRPPARIVDLGGNVGLFGAFASARWPGARLLAYEPDPDNASVMRATITAMGRAGDWEVVEAAAGAYDGTVRFSAGQHAISHVSDDGELSVALRDVLDQICGADLVKIDIEGGEWALLCDSRFAAAPPAVLVMEYHPGGDWTPATTDPHVAVRELLARADMAVRDIWRRDDGHGMVWAWHRAR